MAPPTFIAGVGSDYFDLAVEAAVKALLDAGLTYDDVDQGITSYVFGDSTCGQRVFYALGMTSIPIFNVHNYCSAGSTGLWLANQAIKSGQADCVLVVGFDKMYPGALPQIFGDRTNPLSRILDLSKTLIPEASKGKPSPGWTPQLYANAQAEYLERYGPSGARKDHFAQITSVNRTHGSIGHRRLNQAAMLSLFGAAATVLVSEAFLVSHPHLRSSAIEIAAQALSTDTGLLYEPPSAIELIGSDMTRVAAKKAFAEAQVSPQDISIVELHDCFTANEMCALEGLGLAKEGMAWKLIEDGGITYEANKGPGLNGKRWIVNPSGGLISKGHPLGATGLAQAAELVWHLRGWATSRAVPSTKYCLQHNMGLGGATVVTIYKRADGKVAPQLDQIRPEDDGRYRLGYNPAEEARGVTKADWEAVRSFKGGFSRWATSELPWVRDEKSYEVRSLL